jgi:pyruvate/2-oxoglutarate/acetoin dehydrogenase E1 component
MSSRTEINQCLRQLLTDNNKIILLGQSIRDPYGGVMKCTRGLTKNFDDQIIDLPICESGSTGLVIGLAMQGYIPILELMFSDFITLCYDQLYNMLGKIYQIHKLDLKIIIRTMQNDDQMYGPSHSQIMYPVIESLNEGACSCPVQWIYTSKYKVYSEIMKEAIKKANPLSIIIERKDLY